MEECRIRYIFGAGASANAIPTVAKFTEELGRWGAYIEEYSTKMRDPIQGKRLKEISRWFSKTAEHTRQTFSIDTLAKMYWFRKDLLEYNKVKSVISLLINLQELKNPCDQRYDSFLAALMDLKEGDLKFASSVQLVAWNYDFQFASSYKKIMGIPAEKMKPIGFENFQKIIRLQNINGSSYNEGSYVINTEHNLDIGNIGNNNYSTTVRIFCEELLNAFDITNEQSHWGNIKFSWEREFDHHNLNEFEPDILVIIGYSFPTYNRELDLPILLPNGYPVNKVYIQCNYYDPEKNDDIDGNTDVKNKLISMGVPHDRIFPISSSKEFYIPFEFGSDRDVVF